MMVNSIRLAVAKLQNPQKTVQLLQFCLYPKPVILIQRPLNGERGMSNGQLRPTSSICTTMATLVSREGVLAS